jgi:mycoredoxin
MWRPGGEGSIVLYGTRWCGDCRRARRFLETNGVAYQYVDISESGEAAALVERLNQGNQSVPTIVFPDGSVLVEPSNRMLAVKLGLAG